YIHSDHLGTPHSLSDENGVEVWYAEYDPFGKANINDDPDGDGISITFNIRLPGQYEDSESGLFYNYFRYYDPTLGRYITSDPIGLEGGLNTYAYVESNPLRYVDLFGLTEKDIQTGLEILRENFPYLKVPNKVIVDNLWKIPIIATDPRAHTSKFTKNITLDDQFLKKLDDSTANGMLHTLLHELLHHNQTFFDLWTTGKDHSSFDDNALELLLKNNNIIHDFHKRRKLESSNCD
ncbi:MAG: RHS domain-containing protein, partial [gamma proteobacterium symbiont of Taylorina sp.]|nr:RHS domain-containing protein [gamma proteobacterium symbiont of Taylorina sp.]